MASVLSGLLLLSFAMGMVTGLGIKTSRRHSIIRSSRRPRQHSYWRSGSLTVSGQASESITKLSGRSITNNPNLDSVNATHNRHSEFKE
jgi:hypothetical protein